MTFEFTVLSGLIFWLSFAAVFLIVLNGMGPERQFGECPLHPGVSECVHRRKK